MLMHFALQKLKILPRKWLAMDKREKAFVIASIKEYAENQDRELSKMKNRRG